MEDIVDTGATVVALIQNIEDLGAASVNVCALLNKPSRREHDVEIAYICFDVADVFVVGYGLDYNGEFRNLRDSERTEQRRIIQRAAHTPIKQMSQVISPSELRLPRRLRRTACHPLD